MTIRVTIYLRVTELPVPVIQLLEQLRRARTGHVLEGHRLERPETLALDP